MFVNTQYVSTSFTNEFLTAISPDQLKEKKLSIIFLELSDEKPAKICKMAPVNSKSLLLSCIFNFKFNT